MGVVGLVALAVVYYESNLIRVECAIYKHIIAAFIDAPVITSVAIDVSESMVFAPVRNVDACVAVCDGYVGNTHVCSGRISRIIEGNTATALCIAERTTPTKKAAEYLC